ncbi:MAG: beta-L-arabinofuranosidase domain-containing protein [Pirellulales bacterium]
MSFSHRGLGWMALLSAFTLAGAARGDALADGGSKVKAPLAVKLKAEAFPLTDVRLLDGPFKHAMELDGKYLLALETDRLLHNFRVNAGLPSSAKPLGGWEEPKGELRGHFVGHYLTACALMYASTGDARFKEKGDAVTAGLAECQAKLGSGYLSAYPETFFDRVESRRPVWAPYYTLHKIYAGLLDMYLYCDNQQALEVCKKFADWVIARNGRLSDQQMQAMLGTEHGGMNEVLANLYAITGEEKYLKISLRFNHQAVVGPASQRQDRLTGLHANTQIPKFVGTARQFELTGQEPLRTASTFFWDTVVKERSYVIGGHSDGEMFSAKERLSRALGPNTTETCNTYNVLKLTRHLFAWEPRVEYADYYERALYNHILASQNPETGMMCYYVPLRSGSHKVYNDVDNSFWCCTGTGVENHAKYGDSIYFHDGRQTLFVNLFIASELKWKYAGLTLRQETRYPDEAASKLVFTCQEPLKLAVNIRHPYWATAGFEIRVNGQKQDAVGQPGTWATLDRTWKTGDTVEIAMPFSLRTEGFRDNPRRFAYMDGPLVLCAQVDSRRAFPAVVAEDGNLLGGITPVAGKPNTFAGPAALFRTASGTAGEGSQGVTLEPFYKMHGGRGYVVYWDQFTAEQWKARQEDYQGEQARQKEFEARTVDLATPGGDQNERDHNLQGERTNAGDFGDRKYRHAYDGWFSYDMKVLGDQPMELRVTYWGDDVGRVFDVLVDGEKIATQRLARNNPTRFYDETYPLAEKLTRGKSKITVKFQAQPQSTAGGVFGVRIVKPAEKK